MLTVKRAEQLKVAVNNEPKDFESKADYEQHLIELLQREEVEWIILAGYAISGPDLLDAYEGKILNIHHHYYRNKGKMLLDKRLIVAIR